MIIHEQRSKYLYYTLIVIVLISFIINHIICFYITNFIFNINFIQIKRTDIIIYQLIKNIQYIHTNDFTNQYYHFIINWYADKQENLLHINIYISSKNKYIIFAPHV